MKTKEKFYSATLASTSLVLFFLISILSVASAAPEQSVSPVGPYAYVTNSVDNTVSVIDTTTNNVTATVPVGKLPMGIAVTPDGSKVYVANYLSHNVSVIDTTTNSAPKWVRVKYFPFGVAVSPDGKKVYVTSTENYVVSVINTTTNNVKDTDHLGGTPRGVAVTPDGTKIYVAQKSNRAVSIINTATNNVTATVPVGVEPEGVAVTPDGTKVYVTNENSSTVSVIDTASNTVTATVPVGIGPNGVAVNPAGTKVYVTNNKSNDVSVIDTATNNVTVIVPVGVGPTGIAVTPDGIKVYVTNFGSNTVSVINTTTNTVTATVPVGGKPIAFGQFIGPFSTSITVISPKNRDNWIAGTDQEIKWEYTGNPGSLVNITLLKGEIFDSVINSSTVIGENSNGSYNWSIPLNQKPGNDYKVKISSTTNPAYNNSSTNFSISSPPTTITVILPKDGDNWKAGTNHSITWKYTGNPGSLVKIELLKGGVYNRTIKYSYEIGEEGNGSYNWPILPTQKTGNDYKVKISSITNPAYNNSSTNFNISSS